MTQIRVAGTRPGPVQVDSEHGLTHGEDRTVTDSPLIRAHIAAGNLAELEPVKPTRASRAKDQT